jgi:hypothetical protein
LSASDPIDPGYSTSSSNIPGADIRAQYHTRQLPPVIGTDEFYASIQTELYRYNFGRKYMKTFEYYQSIYPIFEYKQTRLISLIKE